jgi:flagellin
MLQRIRELAVQSANGSNSSSDRKSIQNEVSALSKELDRVATSTQFNGQNVLDGSLTSTQFQVGANSNQTINIGVQAKTVATIANISDGAVNFQLRGSNSIANDSSSKAVTITAKVVGGDLSALAQAVNAQSATTNVTASIKLDATGKKELQLSDAAGNDIQLSTQTGDVALTTAATVRGADIAGAPSTTTAALAANTAAVIGGRVEFSSDSGFSITSTTGIVTGGTTVGSDLQSVSKIDVSTVEGSNAALLTIDSALNAINSNRAALGAIQNRFASTISNLNTTTENLSASRSRIQDTDFAAETANLTRGQILQQAGTAILAQANSLPNGVLSLLRG